MFHLVLLFCLLCASHGEYCHAPSFPDDFILKAAGLSCLSPNTLCEVMNDGACRVTLLQSSLTLDNLSFGGNLSSKIVLAGLRAVEGSVVVSNCSDVASISFPSLYQVTGDFSIGPDVPAAALFVPILAQVGSSLVLSKLSDLEEASFPRLVFIGTALKVAACPKVVLLEFPVLATIGTGTTQALNSGLQLSALPFLTKLLAPALAFVGSDITIGWTEYNTWCPLLHDLSLPGLTVVNGSVTIFGDFGVVDLSRLTLVGRSFAISGYASDFNSTGPSTVSLVSLKSTLQYAQMFDFLSLQLPNCTWNLCINDVDWGILDPPYHPVGGKVVCADKKVIQSHTKIKLVR